MDAAALFAAAGQFEVTETGDSVEEIQSKLAKAAANLKSKISDVSESSKVSMEKLGTSCKDLTSNLSILIANCKIAAAQTGEIPLQQAVLAVFLLFLCYNYSICTNYFKGNENSRCIKQSTRFSSS